MESAFEDFIKLMSEDKDSLNALYRRLLIRGFLLVLVLLIPVLLPLQDCISYLANT